MRAHDSVPADKRDALWKSVSMLQLLVSMVEAMPAPVLEQVDAITANIMGMMNLGSGQKTSGSDPDLQSVMASLGPMLSGLMGGGLGGSGGDRDLKGGEGEEEKEEEEAAIEEVQKQASVGNRKKKKKMSTGNTKRDAFIDKVC